MKNKTKWTFDVNKSLYKNQNNEFIDIKTKEIDESIKGVINLIKYDSRGRRVLETVAINTDCFVYSDWLYVFDRYLSDGKTRRFIGAQLYKRG